MFASTERTDEGKIVAGIRAYPGEVFEVRYLDPDTQSWKRGVTDSIEATGIRQEPLKSIFSDHDEKVGNYARPSEDGLRDRYSVVGGSALASIDLGSGDVRTLAIEPDFAVRSLRSMSKVQRLLEVAKKLTSGWST